jgi:basic secretory peptidase family protein
MKTHIATLALALAFVLAPSRSTPELDRFVLPLSKPIACPSVVVDATALPEQAAWGEKAKTVVEEWFPQLTALLATEKFEPPAEIKLVIEKELKVPAYTSGSTISINGKWITEHPDDLGMVVHELVHVVQRYPRGHPHAGWLTEGIADYLRWWRYEPEYFATHGRPKIDPAKSKYTDSYRTTAYWLAWAAKKYDLRLVRELDGALRRGEDPMAVFNKMTGKDADALWAEFLAQNP